MRIPRPDEISVYCPCCEQTFEHVGEVKEGDIIGCPLCPAWLVKTKSGWAKAEPKVSKRTRLDCI